MSSEPGWWEKFCFAVGLYRDVPEPAPVAAVPAAEPVPVVEGMLTVRDKIETCVAGLTGVAWHVGMNGLEAEDGARLRSVIAERLRVEPSLAVVVEVAAGSQMFAPCDFHFIEAVAGEDVEALAARVVAGRRGVFDSDFFRIDVSPPDGPATRSFAPAGQSVPPRELPAFVVKKENGGGGAPPPVRKR